MKALVVGGGSIGGRHLRNLKQLGVETLGVVEPEEQRRSALVAELGIRGFAELLEGLESTPDFVIVATPTHLHLPQASEIARRGVPVFVEKPLSHKADGLSELAELVERNSLISLVGCNMRFHPGPAKVKQLLDGRAIGKVLFARIHTGSYLPGWRPAADYRLNYAAREETGGGCILDCIHEIDLARWYLGDIVSVFCFADHLSSLQIATEDVAILVCRHEQGAVSEVHLDYVQRTPERGCRIVGELGTIVWDFNSQQVRCYGVSPEGWATFPEPAGWTLNQMYLDEMQYFMDCVHAQRKTLLSIPEALTLMQVVFGAKASARTGTTVVVGNGVTA